MEAYKNNPKRMQGVVHYPIGSVAFFEKETVIPPEHLFPIPHYDLTKQCLSKDAEVIGSLPPDFPEALVRAVKASVTMTRQEQQRILELLRH